MFTSWIISSSLAEYMAGNSRAILSRGQKGLQGLDLSPCSLKLSQIPAPESPVSPSLLRGIRHRTLQGCCAPASQQTYSGTWEFSLGTDIFFLIIVSETSSKGNKENLRKMGLFPAYSSSPALGSCFSCCCSISSSLRLSKTFLLSSRI